MFWRVNHVAVNQKTVTAKLLESPQAVKMDSLTVTRLRSECRLRRLPVSGRKRNLVLRLLPFADVILNGSRNIVSKEIEAGACHTYAGVTRAVAGPIMTSDQCKSEPVESPTAEVQFHRPFVPLDSFVSSWSNFDDDDDDWTMEQGATLDLQFSGIVRRRTTDELERAYPLTVGSASRDKPLTSITNHVGFLMNSDADQSDTDIRGDADDHPPPNDDGERASTPTAGEDETLVCRWLRQQRLIDELRRELCRYRQALATARLQAPARSSNDGSDPPSSLRPFDDIDHVTGDEISPCSASLSYVIAKRYTRLCTIHKDWPCCLS